MTPPQINLWVIIALLPEVMIQSNEFEKGRLYLMRFVIQRVKHSSVTVDGEVVGSIGKGFLVLVGVS